MKTQLKKHFLTIIMCIACYNLSFAQKLQEGQKRWSASSKLTINDFKIKISDQGNEAVYSQFIITHAIGGLDFLKRNLNQKIENLFLGNASWIDTTKTKSIDKYINFQQLQFDLAEIQARKFRKRLFKEKRKISKGFDIVNKINNEIMAEFSEIRLKLIQETKSGTDNKKTTEWKDKITSKLKAMNQFRFENKKKIKL